MTSERYSPASDPSMPGDEIIPQPAVAWDTTAYVPRNPERTWQLLSRIGLAEENGAGYFLPTRVERWLPAKLHSIPSLDVEDLPPQRQVGDRLRDFPEGSYAEIAIFSNAARHLVLDAHWPKNNFHYTWAVQVHPYEAGAQLQTRVRLENPRHPRLLTMLGRSFDQWGMGKVAKGITERIP